MFRNKRIAGGDGRGPRARSRDIDGRAEERGFYTIVAAIMLPLILAVFGLAIDTAHARWARGQLQNATDAAAFAGSKDLNGTAIGRAAATTSAAAYARQYKVDGAVLAAEEIVENVTGRWDFATATFTTSAVSDPFANAIRVRIRRQNMPTFVGSLFRQGQAAKQLSATAVAVAGGTGSVACAAPFTIASCVLKYNSDGSMICPTSLSFQNGLNSIGLTLPDGSSPVNGNKAKPYFSAIVANPSGCAQPAAVGSTLSLQNGNDLAQASVNAINAATSNGANPLAVSVAVIDRACGSGGPTYNGTGKISGFVRMNLVGARWTGAAPNLVAKACPNLAKKGLCLSANCGPINAPSGGTAAVRREKVFLVR